jgi:hypothetical protein
MRGFSDFADRTQLAHGGANAVQNNMIGASDELVLET